MINSNRLPSHPYQIIDFAVDIPNLCSFAGLFCSVLSIYFSLVQNFSIAVVAMLWAVFFDYFDGIIARQMKQRPKIFGPVGQQLDSMIDIVSFGAVPSVFLLSYGQFSPCDTCSLLYSGIKCTVLKLF